MRQRLVCLAVILALCLSGCSEPAPEETLPSESTLQSQPTQSTEESQPTQPTQGPSVPQETETSPVLPAQPEPADGDFVRIRDYIPEATVYLPYATEDNFTGQKIYEFTEPWLRYGTVKKLLAVQEELAQQGLYLKIWDGFRPTAAQFRLWDVCPNPTYVADPTRGFSSHSRGNTVDITLVYADGTELTMPTGFDDFSKLADRDYSDCSPEAARNALLLEQTMEKHGFTPYAGEWWHFSDIQSYPVEESFLPVAEAWYYADCKEYINLRTAPSSQAESIVQIPVGEEFLVLAFHGDFAYVTYRGLQGYVLGPYTAPVIP